MIVLTEPAPAKVNLALHVLGRRPDGYHELDSIVAFAELGDVLNITPSAEFSITASGPFAHRLPAPQSNIIHAAWKAVADIASARARVLPPVHVALTKNLPVAAGIGGGSANAAAAIRAFSKLAGLGLLDTEIGAAALALGADVPVCLFGRAARMQGVGERISPLPDFPLLHAVLVNPQVEVSTAEVFQRLGLAKGESHGSPIDNIADTARWRNDLTVPAMALAPVIADAMNLLQSQDGLRFARMSGSGATCLGIFDNRRLASRAARAIGALRPAYWLSQTVLR